MPEFTFNEGSLELPGGWEDRSVIALSFPTGSPKPEASFAITRDRSATGDPSLASYVDRQLVDMAKSCPKFELVRRERIALEGSNAETMEFSWRSPDGTFVRQTQTILLLKSGTALALTGTAPAGRFQEYSGVFEDLVRTLRLHKEQ
ncbi:MAG TPA: DcrB-related protein [Bryobacteraceae bacterium]|nr:DcrB-related protein [Bryobacteraceae bacterium]